MITFIDCFFQIFFDNNMASGSTYKECSSAEDFSCSAGTFGVSIDDHTHYFVRVLNGILEE